jgi:hypothetical protein
MNLTKPSDKKKVVRVQTGVRIEPRILKMLKSVAAFNEISLSSLLEGIFLHAFEGKQPFGEETLALIRTLRVAYGLDLTANDSHELLEDNQVEEEDEDCNET